MEEIKTAENLHWTDRRAGVNIMGRNRESEIRLWLSELHYWNMDVNIKRFAAKQATKQQNNSKIHPVILRNSKYTKIVSRHASRHTACCY